MKELGFTNGRFRLHLQRALKRAQPLHILVASSNDCAPLLHCRELKSGRRMRALEPVNQSASSTAQRQNNLGCRKVIVPLRDDSRTQCKNAWTSPGPIPQWQPTAKQFTSRTSASGASIRLPRLWSTPRTADCSLSMQYRQSGTERPATDDGLRSQHRRDLSALIGTGGMHRYRELRKNPALIGSQCDAPPD